MDCIFCKIINGDIPSHKLYEDEHVLAFLDITQNTKGHTLIIPKKHFKNVYELDQETAQNIFAVVPKIASALKTSFNPIGLNLVNNNDQPLQSVFHFHVHLIPRYENDNFVIHGENNFGKFDQIYFEEMVKTIKENI